MNTRLIGKIFIGIGIVLLILYIIWIVFRVVKQPEQVEQGGLLPNPFDLLLPGERPGTGVVEQITNIEEIEGLQIEDIVTAPDKRLFRISDSPALAFTLLEDSITTSSIDPITGEKITEVIPSLTVRYVTRDEGFVNDAVVESTRVTTTRKSSAFISGLYNADISRYGVVGQYLSPGNTTPTSFALLLENPDPNSIDAVEEVRSECSLELEKITLGDSSRIVENIQQVLAKSGITAVYEPGVFDETMKQAIIQYQKNNKITPSVGFVGNKTIAQLVSDCEKLLPKSIEPITPQQQENLDRRKISVLPRGIYNVALANDSQILMFLNTGIKNKGLIRTFGSENDTEIYSLPFVDWEVESLGQNILLTTKPSGNVQGHAFDLNPRNKSLEPILSYQSGLSVVPNQDGSQLLYSATEGGQPSISIYNRSTRETIATDIQTFAEKCAWNSESTTIYCMVPNSLSDNVVYPDEWYKRGVNIADSLVRYTLNGEITQQMDIEGEIPAISVDSVEVELTKTGKFLIFRDWKTGYIWGYKLK